VGEVKKVNSGYIDSIIFNGASEANVLPLTSACNTHCIFCSHDQNPCGVEAFYITPRSLAEVRSVLSCLDPAKPVVIGESATRIIEGEPLTHPQIKDILKMVRESLPQTPIRVTTNGILLDETMAAFLRRLGRVTVCLSLNSTGELCRALIMGDTGDSAIKSAALLRDYNVEYHGSIVAMPHLVGWEDIEKAVKYLAACGAETIRIFLPGFTNMAAPALRFEESLQERLYLLIARLRGEVNVPLTCEPPEIGSLDPEVAGVIAGSPASAAGIRHGDVILAVNGRPSLTRVHAFKRIMKAGPCEVNLKRGEQQLAVRIEKTPGQRSGLVMDYDLDPSLIDRVARAAHRCGASNLLALTSEWGGPVIDLGLYKFLAGKLGVQTLVVKNQFFGGSIKAAGLLTVADFLGTLEQDGSRNSIRNKPDLLLLPGLAFDCRGRDLAGRSYHELEEKYGTKVEILS